MVEHLIWDQGVKSSNLLLPTIRACTYFFALGAGSQWCKSTRPEHYQGVAQLVEHRLLVKPFAPLAQLGERHLDVVDVVGSSPARCTIMLL